MIQQVLSLGEVSIKSQVDVKLRSGRTITAGIEQGEVIEAFRILFGEKIGRRLGTILMVQRS